MSQSKKLILVIGATGAQGMAVIDALLAPASGGSPSPYIVRALTRDAKSRRAQLLTEQGVECVEGAFDNFASVAAALDGCYGIWVNTDGFTVGEAKETWSGIKIFELAKQTKTLRHYVYSNLEYVSKLTNYNPEYQCGHYDSKGRVGDFMKQQPSSIADDGMTWSLITTGPYMEMLNHPNCGPLNRRKDGTFVFATPVGQGHAPFIALADLGYFARYTFDHRAETSGEELKVASDLVSWDNLVATFQKVTGQKAVVLHQTPDEFFANFTNTDMPVANERTRGDGSTTFRENFERWWALYRDDIIKRDMDWVKKIHPNLRNLETWMRETKYTGEWDPKLLKNGEDGKTPGLNLERIAQL